MTSSEALRQQVKKYIDEADDKSLRIVRAVLEQSRDDFWDDLPDYVKADVEEAREQLKAGKGIPHAEVMKKYGRG